MATACVALPVDKDTSAGSAPEAASTPGTVYDPSKDRDRDGREKPSGSPLAFEGESTKGTLGPYCYGGVCTDAAGVPVPLAEETLNVPSGAALVLDYGGDGRTAVEDASAFTLDLENVVNNPSGDLLEPDAERPAAKRLATVPEGALWKIRADLSPGAYVIYVLLEIPEGDAYYSFRATVEPA